MKNTKLLSFGVAAPIVAASLLGFADSARAGIFFNNGDQFNFNYSLQLNASGPGSPFGVTAERNGVDIPGGDDDPDIIFAPTVTVGDASVAAGDVVLDCILGNCGPGDQGTIAGAGGSSGVFAGITALVDTGTIRSFDGLSFTSLTEVNSTVKGGGRDFITIVNDQDTPAVADDITFVFSLDEVSDFGVFPNPAIAPTAGITELGDYRFNGEGRVAAYDADMNLIQEVAYELRTTGQFLYDCGLADGCSNADPVNFDGVTNVTSSSASSIVIKRAPEPSTAVSLAALVGLGFFS